jgi:nucleoside phosphorylase
MAELLALRQIALQRDEYTVGWICALSEETAAAVSLLDEVHAPRPQPPTDSTSYRLGRISDHNIVIACPADGTGSQAATAATISRLMSNFPSIKFVLSVGIGSGVPSAGEDIRLGDVVVAMPNSTNSGLVQFDFGSFITIHWGHFP